MAKSKEKRRKKAAEQGGHSVVVEEDSQELAVKIKVIDENPEDKASPVIGYFPSGYDPLKKETGEDSDSDRNCRVKVYRKSIENVKNPRIQVVVDVPGSHVNFVGTSYSGEATTPKLCNYALGVLNKDSGVLKLVPIAANRIFRLDPNIGAPIGPSEEEIQDKAKVGAAQDDKAHKFDHLTEYLSKRNVNRIEKQKTLRQAEDSGMQGGMDEKLEGLKINTKALEATDDARGVPPYDLEATTAERAYPLEKIIVRGEWDYLLDVFNLAQAKTEAKPEAYPSFVCNRLHKLNLIEDELMKMRIAGILSYITHLIKFKDRNSMEGVSSSKHHKLPSIFKQKFASMFGTMDEKRISEGKQKLLISYVLVLSLFVDDFRSDPSDIAKDLRIHPETARLGFEYLGCKFVRENNVLLATLPVPLQFKTIKRRRRR